MSKTVEWTHDILRHIVLLIFNIVGFLGGFLVILGFLLNHGFEGPSWLEPRAILFSNSLTVIGTIIVALTVYPQPHSRPPLQISKYFAFVVIVVGLLTLGYQSHVMNMHPLTVNGFALLGLAGAIFRILPFTTR